MFELGSIKVEAPCDDPEGPYYILYYTYSLYYGYDPVVLAHGPINFSRAQNARDKKKISFKLFKSGGSGGIKIKSPPA
jgi:hypothetical protein